jgi:putative endonuclease
MDRQYWVYILASRMRGTLDIGLTNDLARRIDRRIDQHRSGAVPGFTKQYRVNRLVYAEIHATLMDARQREHSMKRWLRAWKIQLIERDNPDWLDLAEQPGIGD